VGPFVTQKHYGLFRFREKGKKLAVEVDLKGEAGQTFYEHKITFEE
jgi:alkaline phosphatase D